MRDQSGQARDEKYRVAELVREPQIRADRRDRAVDVHRQVPPDGVLPRLEDALGRAKHPHVLALELELQRHLEEPRGARVARMEAMTESWGRLPLAQAFVHQGFCRLLERAARAP